MNVILELIRAKEQGKMASTNFSSNMRGLYPKKSIVKNSLDTPQAPRHMVEEPRMMMTHANHRKKDFLNIPTTFI